MIGKPLVSTLMEATFLLLVLIVYGVPASPVRQAINCGGQAVLNFGQVMHFTSPGFPNAYQNGLNCAWWLLSPFSSAIRLHCQHFDTAPSQDCSEDSFHFSPSGDFSLQDVVTYCGRGTLDVTTTSNIFRARFFSQNVRPNTHLGFWCLVTAVPANGGAEVATPNPDPQVTNPPGTTAPPETMAPPGTTEPPAPSGDCSCGIKGDSRIVGGQETDVNEWPWQAGIRRISVGDIFCGALLINDQWLVTAAHCVKPFATDDLFVSLGAHDKTSSGDSTFTEHIIIDQVIIHEDYDEETIDNDIALIRLSSPVIYTEGIRPICLPFQYTSKDLSGEQGTVTGWGTLEFQGILSDVLMEVELPILTTSECEGFDIVSGAITDNMICTYEEGKDSCQGDSGGPLQWEQGGRQYLVGLVSWGFGCGDENAPGVYTKVTNYLQWIQQQISDDLCSPSP